MKISMLTPISITKEGGNPHIFFMDFTNKKLFDIYDRPVDDESLIEEIFASMFHKKICPKPPVDVGSKVETSKGVINGRIN